MNFIIVATSKIFFTKLLQSYLNDIKTFKYNFRFEENSR